MDAGTNGYTCMDTNGHADTQGHTDTWTQGHMHTDTQTDTDTHRYTHAHTDTQTWTHMNIETHTQTNRDTHRHMDSTQRHGQRHTPPHPCRDMDRQTDTCRGRDTPIQTQLDTWPLRHTQMDNMDSHTDTH